MHLGKNHLGDMMITTSEKAQLSKIYTNHQIQHTTATGMKKIGHNLKEISDVTKHHILQSLQHYLDVATIEDKERYNNSLHKYTKKSQSENATAPTSKPNKVTPPTRDASEIDVQMSK